MKQWKPLYKDGITDKPTVPEALQGTTLELEGTTLELVGGAGRRRGQLLRVDSKPEGGGRWRHRLRRGVPVDGGDHAGGAPGVKVKASYPDAALDIVLKIGSEASIKPAKKTARK